jgi:DNA-binding winged helix-turn-helix (wHTH) protein
MEVRCFPFGPFMLIPERHVLLRGGTPVRLGSRPLDILTVLVERAGELLDKQKIMSLVWNDTFVDESNLKVNIAAIRKAMRAVLYGDETLFMVLSFGVGRQFNLTTHRKWRQVN